MIYNEIVSPFCERQIFPDKPEYINAFTALTLCYYGSLTDNNLVLQLIYNCIFFNGISAFLYHWYGWYIFKLFDEFSMLIPVWIGISQLLNILNYSYIITIFSTIFTIILLSCTTFEWFEPYFPIAFTIELLSLIPLYTQTKNIYPDNTKLGPKGIIICTLSGATWFLTERFCNKYLIFGHGIWHLGMCLGLNYLLKYLKICLNKNNFID